jgi:hypothetical protein
MKKVNIALTLIFVLASFISFAQSDSKVIVYRKGSIYGGLAKYKVIVDGKEMETLKGKSAYEFNLAPGTHTISPKQAKRAITIKTEAGKNYAVKYRTMLGLFGARPKLKVLTISEAKEDSKIVKEKFNTVM